MIFNPKHSHINNQFAELGCTIGKLHDSSKYDERFINIADQVIMLNEGGRVDRKTLTTDIELMLGMMEKEGYWYEREVVEEIKERRQLSWSWMLMSFRLIKIYWQLPDNDGKISLAMTVTSILGLIMVILGFQYSKDVAGVLFMFGLLLLTIGSLSHIMFFLEIIIPFDLKIIKRNLVRSINVT